MLNGQTAVLVPQLVRSSCTPFPACGGTRQCACNSYVELIFRRRVVRYRCSAEQLEIRRRRNAKVLVRRGLPVVAGICSSLCLDKGATRPPFRWFKRDLL